jgi:hypothetical protein
MSIRRTNYYRSDTGIRTDFQVLEDLIRDTCGVACTIRVKPNEISIRTKDYTDFVLARAAIKGRTSKAIRQDVFFPLEKPEPSTPHPLFGQNTQI